MNCSKSVMIVGVAVFFGLINFSVHWYFSDNVAHLIMFILSVCIGTFFAWYLYRREIIFRENETKLQRILESIRDYVFILEGDGRVSYVNPAGYAAIGAETREQKENVLIQNILDETDLRFAYERMQLLFEGKKEQLMHMYNLHNLTNEQGIIPVEIYTTLFCENGVKKILGVARPVADRMQLEAERMRVERMHSIGVMAGGVAHDFNNLLQALSGAASILMMKKDESSSVAYYAQRIIEVVERATGLTHQLLTFAKGGSSVKEIASLDKVIKESISLPLGASSRCVCKSDLPSDLYQICMDCKQISRVVQNLIINASHAMPMGGVIRIVAENVTLSDDNHFSLAFGKYVHFFVQDTGIGIAENMLTKIFDPYFTTKGDTGEGSGLGLSIAYAIMKKHDGHIYAESTVGKGTTFHMYLPAAEIRQDDERQCENIDVAMENSYRILVVDDQEENLSMYSEMLNLIGCSCVTASSVMSGYDKYKEAYEDEMPFDLVVTDMTMPGGMGGIELIDMLRAYDPKVKVIVTSGYSIELAHVTGIPFLPKPFTIAMLKDVIIKVMQ